MRAPQFTLRNIMLSLCLLLLPVVSMAEGLSAAEIKAALNNPARSDADKARDPSLIRFAKSTRFPV